MLLPFSMGCLGGGGGCGFSPTVLNAFPRYTYSYPHDTRQYALINSISLQVHAQRDALMAKVDKLCQAVLREVDEANDATDKQLTADAQKMQRELDSLLQLRQRVYHALGEASDAEKVCVEKEMTEGQGSERHLDRVKAVSYTHLTLPTSVYV